MDIRDLDFELDPEKRKELEKIYGKVSISWNTVTSWDDVITSLEKSLTIDLRVNVEGKERCPYFRVNGSHFCYCDARVHEMPDIFSREDEIPTINSAEYHSHIDHFSMQLWCLNDKSKYGKCISYKELNKDNSE